MNIFLTGSPGFIGSAVLDYWLGLVHSVKALDRIVLE